MECSRCGKVAVFESKYSREALCKTHFMEGVERRFKQEIRSQIHFNRGDTRISVAISGGKDSSVLLYLLHRVLSSKRDVVIDAFTIDEGIAGYRHEGKVAAQELCNSLGIAHRVISFQEAFGTEMDSVVKEEKLQGSPCAYCGPMRRDLMNRMSSEVNADYVALGINLDDYTQSIMMNVLRGDFEKMLRMAPHRHKIDGLVPRIVPMRRIYEKEVKLYAILAGIKHDAGWCPYAGKAQRNGVRDMVNDLEEEHPGTKLAVERFLERLQIHYGNREDLSIGKCIICGAPSNADVCQACARSGKKIKN